MQSTSLNNLPRTNIYFTCRPELLAVGASDAYARLYDRRKIKLEKIETSKSSRELPKDCVTYFCPGHFSRNTTFSSYDSKAITYLTFNSDGNELLVNMGAEHIYLYDIDNAQQPVVSEFLVDYLCDEMKLVTLSFIVS